MKAFEDAEAGAMTDDEADKNPRKTDADGGCTATNATNDPTAAGKAFSPKVDQGKTGALDLETQAPDTTASTAPKRGSINKKGTAKVVKRGKETKNRAASNRAKRTGAAAAAQDQTSTKTA